VVRHLVQKHLENVSGDLIAEYKDLIAQHARGKCGVYVLYNNGQMYYVGLASNLNARLNQHMRDRHRGKWDRFSMYLTRNDYHMRELEALLHRVLRPEGNRQIGRLRGSEDLRKPLRQEMREIHRQKLVKLMGDRVRARQVRTGDGPNRREPRVPSELPLAGWVQRAVTLKAWYKGHEYRARLLANGTIRFDGKAYSTPSGAAEAFRKLPTNGWWMWHMQDASGDWVRLRDLRG